MNTVLALNSPALAPATGPVSQLSLADNVPRQLWLRQFVIAVLTVVVTVCGFYAYRAHLQVVQTIGRDAVPSIVAAEKIRTTLADAHTEIINVFLTNAQPDSSAMQAYGKAIDRAHEHLVSASQNITFGEEERRPILSVLQQLSQYERLIGQALTFKGYSDALGRADTLMRERILPAAVALDHANFVHLDAAFSEGRQQSRTALYIFVAAACVLALVLLETQFKLHATFRRVINPALACALLVLVISASMIVDKSHDLLGDIRSAKEDAFDSVHALSQAQALAYSANAAESMYLLMHGRATQAGQTDIFQSLAKQMYAARQSDGQSLPSDLKSLKGRGLLADELANITYDGEEKLARASLSGWQEYVRIDAQIRALEAAGRHDEAVALCVGTQPAQSDWAFARFTKDLGATLQLNETQFALAIDKAFASLQWLWLLLLPVFLGPLLGTVLGLRQRLAEFRA